jgi:hypothetical protein
MEIYWSAQDWIWGLLLIVLTIAIEAQFQAEKTHGRRPSQLIAWRNYEAIGEYGIDNAREDLFASWRRSQANQEGIPGREGEVGRLAIR